MIEQLKTDRVVQVILVGIIIAGLFACVIFLGLFFFVTTAQTDVSATVGPTPTVTLLEFDGTGDKVITFNVLKSGPTRFGFVYRGNDNFFVYLLNADGTILSPLANKSGQYTGEKIERLDAGQYNLEITADGSWTIIILPPQ